MVIARLEDADYEGHSLSMLQRIAHVLNQRLEIQLIPIAQTQSTEEQGSAYGGAFFGYSGDRSSFVLDCSIARIASTGDVPSRTAWMMRRY
jgi:hypothetical protein